jgi:predicted transcriptional regulator YdeE
MVAWNGVACSESVSTNSGPQEQAAENLSKKETTVMFVRKYNVEVIALDEKIMIVGLSFAKCKRTGSAHFTSPFDLYSLDSFELQANIKHLKRPQVGYGVWTGMQDVIVGKAVTDVNGQDDMYDSCTIPAGRYVKLSFNAETFEELVMDAIHKAWDNAGTDAFLESNNLVADRTLHIEVYPHATIRTGCENGPGWGPKYTNVSGETPTTDFPEMYFLFPVKEKE